jgi:thiol-disulfide isomerase/thioredoxin
MTMRLALILLLPAISVSVNAQTSQTASEPYLAVFFQDRDPFPKGLPLNLQNVRTAIIPMSDSLAVLQIIHGHDAPGNDVYNMVYAVGGKVNISGLTVSRVDADQLRATSHINPHFDDEITYPLELRIFPSVGILLYKWVGGDERSSGHREPVSALSLIRRGQVFPELSMKSLEGVTLDIGTMRGQVVVMNSWAISCIPCIEEMPGLNELVEKYAERQIRFVAIADNNATDLRRFFKTKRFDYEQMLASAGSKTLFGNTYPRNVVLDPKGRVVFDKLGAGKDTRLEIDKAIQQALTGAE